MALHLHVWSLSGTFGGSGRDRFGRRYDVWRKTCKVCGKRKVQKVRVAP